MDYQIAARPRRSAPGIGRSSLSDTKEIIYLEPDEEITSIIDKLKSLTEVDEVFLVAPKNAAIVQSVVNLKILKKEADKLKKSIAFVTSDHIGRNLASQVGIDVYETINASKPMHSIPKAEPNINETIEIDMTEAKPAPVPKELKVNYYDASVASKPDTKAEEPVTHSAKAPISATDYNEPVLTKPKKPKKWILKLAIVLVLVGVGVFSFFYFYPKATVYLTVKAESITEDVKMTVDTHATAADSKNKVIPGETISTQKELTKNFTATGSKDVGEKSSGSVTLSNGTGTVVSVPAGSQVEAKSGLLFITTAAVSVPAATASVDGDGNVIKNPGKSDVSVQAKESGDSYNIGPTTFSVANYPALSGANGANFAGGSSKKVTIISQDDLDKAKTTLDGELKTTIKDELSKSATDKKLTFLSDAIDYSDVKFSSSQEAGTEVNTFSGTYALTGKTIAFNEQNYQDNLVAVLGDKIPTDKQLILSKDDAITQGSFNADYAKGILTVDGTITTKLAPKTDDSAIKNSIKGKSFISAENTMRSNTSISDTKIDSNLSWFKKVPSRTQNIIINKTYKVQ